MAKAISASSRGAVHAGSITTVDPGVAAAWTRAPSLRWASSPKPAAQNALKPRKPRVAVVRTRIRTTAPKAPTARAVSSVQLMNARFSAIRWAGIVRVYDGPTEVPDGIEPEHPDHVARARLRRGHDARRQDDPVRPVVRQSAQCQAGQCRRAL